MHLLYWNNLDASISFLIMLISSLKYVDGTTDITRTVHFGKPSEHEKACYTAVSVFHCSLWRYFFLNLCWLWSFSFESWLHLFCLNMLGSAKILSLVGHLILVEQVNKLCFMVSFCLAKKWVQWDMGTTQKIEMLGYIKL